MNKWPLTPFLPLVPSCVTMPCVLYAIFRYVPIRTHFDAQLQVNLLLEMYSFVPTCIHYLDKRPLLPTFINIFTFLLCIALYLMFPTRYLMHSTVSPVPVVLTIFYLPYCVHYVPHCFPCTSMCVSVPQCTSIDLNLTYTHHCT